jgi:hypothetical protein
VQAADKSAEDAGIFHVFSVAASGGSVFLSTWLHLFMALSEALK